MGMGAGARRDLGKDWRRKRGPVHEPGVDPRPTAAPATPTTDGWLTFGLPVTVGGHLPGRASRSRIEAPDPCSNRFESCQAAAARGASAVRPASRSSTARARIRSPWWSRATASATRRRWSARPRRAARGGLQAPPRRHRGETPGVVKCVLQPGEQLRGLDAGGGGYGDPLEREPARVLRDVRQSWERSSGGKVYGVVFSGGLEDETFAVDAAATARRRREIAAQCDVMQTVPRPRARRSPSAPPAGRTEEALARNKSEATISCALSKAAVNTADASRAAPRKEKPPAANLGTEMRSISDLENVSVVDLGRLRVCLRMS